VGLRAWALQHHVDAASFSGIGAFRTATLGYFDVDAREYVPIELDEQVEVLSLQGNIAMADDEPTVHAHVVVAKRDGTAHGGHLLTAYVRPTLELIFVESVAAMRRTLDPASGLPLLDPQR
jgi:predicted DNA-binding protein with PD1-like motif